MDSNINKDESPESANNFDKSSESSSSSSHENENEKATTSSKKPLKIQEFTIKKPFTKFTHNEPSNHHHHENIYQSRGTIIEEVDKSQGLEELLHHWNDSFKRNKLDEHFQQEHQVVLSLLKKINQK
jgi:hypothetical protein